jgi:hypothetical protein
VGILGCLALASCGGGGAGATLRPATASDAGPEDTLSEDDGATSPEDVEADASGGAGGEPDSGSMDVGALNDAIGGMADAGSSGGSGDATNGAAACPDIFDQRTLRQYWIDISADEWAKMNVEFMDVVGVLAGNPKSYHPVVFHFGSPDGETVTDAAMRLKGQSSWVQTIQNDPLPKMQVVISFNQNNPNGKFHGVSKLVFDMPRSDWTFLHERLANNWWRQRNVMAPCSNSGQLFINGSYYGLYVVEENVGHHLVKEYFPGNSDGNLFKGGAEPDQNGTTPNVPRLLMFQAATDIKTISRLVDLDTSVLEWAGDALLNNGDGYYGGAHNFYLYDQGEKGYVWLPADTDATFDWLALNSAFAYNDHPIYWWEGRSYADRPGPAFLAVVNDPAWRQRYIDAIAAQVDSWNVAEIQSWIDTWSAQISKAVSDDPRKQATVADWQMAVSIARNIVDRRPAYLQAFLRCERGQEGDDADGDGVRWCNDCRDNDPSVHPGAAEVCGNQIDDNCNGIVDEGCPIDPDGGAGAEATAPASSADAGAG